MTEALPDTEISDMERVNKTRCKTCPFGGEEPIALAVEKQCEIIDYVLKGTNHLCHSDNENKTVCRGARDLFLVFATMRGNIKSPTDESLALAMTEAGITPKPHICK